jgi:hypothetical protein
MINFLKNTKYYDSCITVLLITFISYVVYASYQLYQFHSYEKQLKRIFITTDFIPKELCGTLFDKDKIVIDEDIALSRAERLKLNLSVSMQDYYLGYTVLNLSDNPISALTIDTWIIFPNDQNIKINFGDSIAPRILFESQNDKLLEPGQSFRRCLPILLAREYSATEFFKARRISKVDWVKW